MPDIVLDTNLLADFIASYYLFEIQSYGKFEKYNSISVELASNLNSILINYRNNNTLQDGIVVASTFGFIEIARKFEIISNQRFGVEKFKAFIDTPPHWFTIVPLSNDLFNRLIELPQSVVMPDDKILPIEWADAIHVATALDRDENCKIAATDGRIINIPLISNRLIH